MSDFQQYRRSQIAELRPYEPGDGVFAHVSISEEDRKTGSPKLGDMIARNPKNHADQWLVAARYFADNFEPMSAAVNSHATLTAALEEARGALEPFVAKMQKVEDRYRKRGGNPDAFPDTHLSFNISADSRELPLRAWRRARVALATINAALGRTEG